jgi:hypothetical protein
LAGKEGLHLHIGGEILYNAKVLKFVQIVLVIERGVLKYPIEKVLEMVRLH